MCNSAAHNSRPNRESLSKRLGKVARQIRARDGERCIYCSVSSKVELRRGRHMHLDHLTPKAAGGADVATNLVLACTSCNSKRQDKALPVWCREIKADARAIRAQARRALPAV